jgi:hypothetical protein
MMKKLIFSFCALFLLVIPLAHAQILVRKVTPPKQIDHDERTLNYNLAWQDEETYCEADLDDDPENEIIISFVATYKPKIEPLEDKKQTYLPPKKELPILQNYAFTQIYDRDAGGHYKLVKTFTGMDRLGKVEILNLNDKGPKAIALFSPGGERYVDLSIYQWHEGGYRLLFNKGSSDGIEVDSKEKPVVIRIGKNQDITIWNTDCECFKKQLENNAGVGL